MIAKGLALSQKHTRPRDEKELDLFRHRNQDQERVDAQTVISQEVPLKGCHEEATVMNTSTRLAR